MEAQALPQQRPFPWRRTFAGLAVLAALALIGTGIRLCVWLAGYEPLGLAGSYVTEAKPGVMVEPPAGSGGVEVFFPRYQAHGTFEVVTTFANHAPFAITLLGPSEPAFDASPFRVVRAEVALRDYDTSHVRPVDRSHALRLAPGEDRTFVLTYRFVSRCLGGQPPGYWKTGVNGVGTGGVRSTGFRLRYEHVFEKTHTVQLPLAITLVCKSGVTAPGG